MYVCVCWNKAAAMIGSIESIEYRNGKQNNILAGKPQLEVINMHRGHRHNATHTHTHTYVYTLCCINAALMLSHGT